MERGIIENVFIKSVIRWQRDPRIRPGQTHLTRFSRQIFYHEKISLDKSESQHLNYPRSPIPARVVYFLSNQSELFAWSEATCGRACCCRASKINRRQRTTHFVACTTEFRCVCPANSTLDMWAQP